MHYSVLSSFPPFLPRLGWDLKFPASISHITHSDGMRKGRYKSLLLTFLLAAVNMPSYSKSFVFEISDNFDVENINPLVCI